MALTKENAIDFLSSLEGYHQQLKLLHWSTDNHSRHLLTDEVDESVLSFEDAVAENVMGILDEKISEGLKSMLPENKELKGLLNELKDDVLSFESNFEGEKDCKGLVNCCDDFLETVNKYKYLETLS